MRNVACILMLLAVPALAAGQDLAKGEFPPGFKVRTDNATGSTAEIVFVSMSPGWHVTTGPAAILYDPLNTSSGEYRVESEIFLFDPGQRNEAFGVFFGGKDLNGDYLAYTYFVIRRSGEFTVKRRAGSVVTTVTDWTAHPAILKWEDRGEGKVTAKNILAVDVGRDAVRFLVNDQEVGSVARARVDTDGVAGMRVNHELNLHVSKVAVTRK